MLNDMDLSCADLYIVLIGGGKTDNGSDERV